MDAFGGGRVTVRPPERGIFPLDHDGECKLTMKAYLKCLKENNKDNFPCKEYSKAYLQCRMDKDLMSKEDMKDLGFDHGEYKRVQRVEGEKEAKGFIGGLDVRPVSRWWNK